MLYTVGETPVSTRERHPKEALTIVERAGVECRVPQMYGCAHAMHSSVRTTLNAVLPERGAGAPARQPSQGRASGCRRDRKSTRLNSSHANISYAVFCLKKK